MIEEANFESQKVIKILRYQRWKFHFFCYPDRWHFPCWANICLYQSMCQHRKLFFGTHRQQSPLHSCEALNSSLAFLSFQIYPDPDSEKVIMGSLVFCIHHKEGCKWSDELRKLKVRRRDLWDGNRKLNFLYFFRPI